MLCVMAIICGLWRMKEDGGGAALVGLASFMVRWIEIGLCHLHTAGKIRGQTRCGPV